MRRMFLIVVGLAVLAGLFGADVFAAQPKFGRVSVTLKTPGTGNRICGKVVYRVDGKAAGFNLVCNTKAKEEIQFRWGRALVVRLQEMPTGCRLPPPHTTRVTALTSITFTVGCARKPSPPSKSNVPVVAQVNCVNGGFGKLHFQATVGGRTSSFDGECGASVQVALVSAKTQVRVCLTGIPIGVRLTSAECVDVVAGVTPAPTFGLEREAVTSSSPLPSLPTSAKLTVATTGSGRVSGPGIDCPGDCVEVYLKSQMGAPITLTATASDGSEFAGWEGGCAPAGRSRSCILTMDQDRSVAVTFKSPPRLTVAVSGGGSVTSSPSGISCSGDCVEQYPTGTPVTLTATPASGWILSNWSGGCSGSSSSCVVALDEGKNVTATFTQSSPSPSPTTPSPPGGGGPVSAPNNP